MKNSTKFLDDIMGNNIHQYLVIDVTDKPTLDDWWRFEEECLGTHFGLTKEEGEEWWRLWFTAKKPDNFIMLEINIKDGRYEIIYITEVDELECFTRPIDLLIPFSEIYNTYLLKSTSETLDENKDKNVHFISQYELDELCGIAEEREQAQEYVKKAVQDTLAHQNKAQSDTELILEEQLKEALEKIDSLNSTIKDMEEIIQRYEHNLAFVWAMLEQKIKEK